MNILLVSDNHGLTDELNIIKKRHKVNYMIHCGDSEFKMDDPLMEGFIKVSGNCDADARFPNEQIIQIGNRKIFVTHGHLYGVKMNLLSLSYRAQEEGAHIICYGHTHIAHAERINDQLFINPGSIRNSKGPLVETYVVLNMEEIKNDTGSIPVTVNFYSLSGELLKDETYKCLI